MRGGAVGFRGFDFDLVLNYSYVGYKMNAQEEIVWLDWKRR